MLHGHFCYMLVEYLLPFHFIRIEADVKIFQEQKETLDKIELIKKKLQWLLYEKKNVARKKVSISYKY